MWVGACEGCPAGGIGGSGILICSPAAPAPCLDMLCMAPPSEGATWLALDSDGSPWCWPWASRGPCLWTTRASCCPVKAAHWGQEAISDGRCGPSSASRVELESSCSGLMWEVSLPL